MVVELRLLEDTIEVDVLDRGSGIRRLTPPTGDHMGVGLSVMAALADRAQFLDREEGGTEVRLTFRDRHRHPALRGEHDGGCTGPEPRLTGDLVITLSAVALLRAVLNPVARGWAAIGRFPLDRIEAVASVAEAVGALAVSAGEGPVDIALTDRFPLLELAVGPFAPGSLDGDSAGALAAISELTEEMQVQTAGGAEILRVTVSGSPPGPEAA